MDKEIISSLYYISKGDKLLILEYIIDELILSKALI